MYCVFDKRKTDTKDIVAKRSKNNRVYLSGVCVECGKRKAMFVSEETAKQGGFLPLIASLLGAVAGPLIKGVVNKIKGKDFFGDGIKHRNKK